MHGAAARCGVKGDEEGGRHARGQVIEEVGANRRGQEAQPVAQTSSIIAACRFIEE